MDEFEYDKHNLQIWLQEFAPKGFHKKVPDIDAFEQTIKLVRHEYMPRMEAAMRAALENNDLSAITVWGKRLDEVDTWATDMEDLVHSMMPRY